MARHAPGMGRGLSAILSVTEDQNPVEELRELPLDLIVPNPRQPRRTQQHRPANRDQRIARAQHQAVDDLLREVHALGLPVGLPVGLALWLPR